MYKIARHEAGNNVPTLQAPQFRGLLTDVNLRDRLDDLLKKPNGGDRKSENRRINVDNVHVDPRPTGNAEATALRRLRKDRPDLHADVLAEKLSGRRSEVK